jgi:protoporphyrinogen/coproporphyrinogen III oxidase
MSRVVIVGAGITGLTLAYRLGQLKPDLDITLLESRDRPGGTVWTERRDGFQIEIGPNGFLDNVPSTVSLCADLGLKQRLVPASETAGRNRYLFLDGRLRRLPYSVPSFLGSNLLSWRGKLAALTERFRGRADRSADESIDAFARRRFGSEAAKILADALVTGIHAGDPSLLSLRAAFPRLAALEAEHGSVLTGMARAARAQPGPRRMWSFPEGLRCLIELLDKKLRKPAILGVRVRRIEKAEEGWIVKAEGADHWPADAVVLACPAFDQGRILAEVDSELAEKVGAIAYNKVAVVALGYQETDVPLKPDGFGFIAPQRSRRDILGVQWCSSIFPDRAPQGFVLFRALCGGWNRPDILDWDDDRIVSAVREELRLAQGIVVPPRFRHIVRWDRAIPQYHLGHLERVNWIEKRARQHAGLHLTGNSYRGVSLNDCTLEAERLARTIADSLAN